MRLTSDSLTFGRPPPINLLHESLCPSDRIGYGSYRGRNPCSTVVLRQFPSREDARRDQQNALATLIHEGSLAQFAFCSPKLHGVRIGRAGLANGAKLRRQEPDQRQMLGWSQSLKTGIEIVNRG